MSRSRLVAFYENDAEARKAFRILRKNGFRAVALVSKLANGEIQRRDAFP